MAKLIRRPDSENWYIDATVDGKRYKFSTGTPRKDLAQRKLDDFNLKAFKQELGVKPAKRGSPTIAEFLRRYQEHRQGSSPFDVHSEVSKLRILGEFFARKSIRYLMDITPVSVDEFLNLTLAGLKPSTKQNYFNLLKRLLNKATEWEIIEYNPIGKMKSPKVPQTFNFFEKGEIIFLIDKAEEPLKVGIMILAYTGMRSGELLNLRCRDVDLKANNIRVWPYDGFTPKGKRPRTVPISKKLKPVLSKQIKGKSPDDYVYRPYGHPLRLTKRFSILVNKLGLKGTLHDLRHSFATHLAKNSVPIIRIKELLGHSNIATTNVYAHFLPNPNEQDVQSLSFD